jgi:hypothetical protein
MQVHRKGVDLIDGFPLYVQEHLGCMGEDGFDVAEQDEEDDDLRIGADMGQEP